MSFAPNTWHPLARYGVALLAHQETDELLGDETARVDAAVALIEEALTTFMIAPAGIPDEAAESVTYHYHADAKPGKANGQISANGFFSAPHIVTGNNAADIVKEARARIREAGKPKRPSSVELKKSFAPTVAKINAGSKSMSNPRVSFEEALFTALAALHPLKPAAYDYDIGSNVAIVPDLPLDKLGAYLRIVATLCRNLGADAWEGRYTSKKYGRPLLYKGNFAKAPSSVDVGALGLLAAIGLYAREATDLDEAEARPVLEAMAERPIYLFANGGSSQQAYSHHLVDLALTGALHAATNAINRVELTSIDGNKFSDPKWDRFKISAGHFLTLFRPAYARDFFAYRAVYPPAFRAIFLTYFQRVMQISEDIVAAAEAYGRTLNNAAYIGARAEIEDDKRRGRTGAPSLRDYKNRILTQLESSIRSAKTGPELISRLSTIVGRTSGLDFKQEAQPFMRAAVAGTLEPETARQLATAFMRLMPPKQEDDSAGGGIGEADDVNSEDAVDESTSHMPADA